MSFLKALFAVYVIFTLYQFVLTGLHVWCAKRLREVSERLQQAHDRETLQSLAVESQKLIRFSVWLQGWP